MAELVLGLKSIPGNNYTQTIPAEGQSVRKVKCVRVKVGGEVVKMDQVS